jgi:hypothetical protein
MARYDAVADSAIKSKVNAAISVLFQAMQSEKDIEVASSETPR